MFYTYFHTRNDTGAVFYIGKGSSTRATSPYDRNPHWKNIVAKHGHTVHMAMTDLSEQDAFEHEKFLIACFKDMGVLLTNCTNGGEGVSGYTHSDESRKKISASSKERMLNLEYREKLHNTTRGTKLSPQVVARMKAGMKGIPKSQEHKIKIGNLHRGKTMSQEAKNKIGAAHIGRKRSVETRERISASAKVAWIARRNRTIEGNIV